MPVWYEYRESNNKLRTGCKTGIMTGWMVMGKLLRFPGETGATVSSAEQKYIFLLWLCVEHYCKRRKSKGRWVIWNSVNKATKLCYR